MRRPHRGACSERKWARVESDTVERSTVCKSELPVSTSPPDPAALTELTSHKARTTCELAVDKGDRTALGYAEAFAGKLDNFGGKIWCDSGEGGTGSGSGRRKAGSVEVSNGSTQVERAGAPESKWLRSAPFRAEVSSSLGPSQWRGWARLGEEST